MLSSDSERLAPPSSEEEQKFHMFDEIDEADVNIIHLESPRKPLVKRRTQTLIHMLDATFGQLNFFTLWRFVAVALNMCVRWSTGSIFALNFILIFMIAVFSVAWPTLLFEYGISVATSMENVGAMASLGRRARPAGLNWAISVLLLLTTVPLASYAAIFCLDASKHWANFASPGIKAQDALDLYVGRECTKYHDYVPHLSPMLCGPAGKRLDISCYDEAQCHLWSGSGRCLAVPWAPASEYLFTSKEEYDAMLDQDFPQYCAARRLHDISTNHAKAVINHAGLTGDWKGVNSSRLPVACSVVIVLAGVITVLSALGVSGNRRAAMCRISSQLLRIGIGIFGFIATVALLGLSIHWWRRGSSGMIQRDAVTGLSRHPSYKDWNKGLRSFSLEDFVHPDIWAYSMIQALLTLRVGSGQNELVGSRTPEKSHTMLTCLGYSLLQLLMCAMIFASCWLAYGLTAMRADMGTQPEVGYSVIRFDLRNNAYGPIFTAIQTMFDNSPRLDGSVNDKHHFGTVFWLAMTLLGVNGVSHAFDVIAGALHQSEWNWRAGVAENERWKSRKYKKAKRGFTEFCDRVVGIFSSVLAWLVAGSPRWVWSLIVVVITWTVTVQEWFGTSWGMTVTYSHFTTHLLYPFTILYHTIAMGWMANDELRVRHYGRRFTLVQLFVFLAGATVAGFIVCGTWRRAPVYTPLIGGAVGAVVMATSYVLPLWFIQRHDAYGHKHEKQDQVKMVVCGTADHIRNELNLRCCHTNQIFRITLLTILGVRFVVPSAMILAAANILTLKGQLLWNFSPYKPFIFHLLSDQFLVLQSVMERADLIRAPAWLIALAAIGPCLMILIPPFIFFWPQRIDWLVPRDVDEHFFYVHEAIEKFADSAKNLTQTPVEELEPIANATSQFNTIFGSEYNTVVQ